MRLDTAAELAPEPKAAVPGSLREALVAPELCDDLADYLTRVDLALALLQTPAALSRITKDGRRRRWRHIPSLRNLIQDFSFCFFTQEGNGRRAHCQENGVQPNHTVRSY